MFPSMPISVLVVWNDFIYSGDNRGEIKKWNTEGVCLKTFEGHQRYDIFSNEVGEILMIHKTPSAVTSLVVWNDFLYSGSKDKTIKQWNQEGVCLQTFIGHSDRVDALVVWNGYLYSAALDEIKKWNQEGVCLQNLENNNNNTGWVNIFVIWNDHLYSGSDEGDIKKWNEEGVCINTFSTEDMLTSLVVWNDHLYSGSADGEIKKWNQEGVCIQQFENMWDMEVNCLVVYKDYLYSGGYFSSNHEDGIIQKWNQEGVCIRTIEKDDDDIELTPPVSLVVWNDHMYSGAEGDVYGGGGIKQWVDEEWLAALKRLNIRTLLLIYKKVPRLMLNEDTVRVIATFL